MSEEREALQRSLEERSLTVDGVVSLDRRSLSAEEAAEVVLVLHQRHDISGCGCGWAELGKSHPRHVLAELRAAGLEIRMAVKDGEPQ